MTLSQSVNGASVTITVNAALVRSLWHNMEIPQTKGFNENNGGLIVTPLVANADVFHGVMTINTMWVIFSMTSATQSMSVGNTYTFSYGLYKQSSDSLTLVNSVSSSFGWTAATNASRSFAGNRVWSIHSSQWSSQPVLSVGRFWHAYGVRKSVAQAAGTWAMWGSTGGQTQLMSGTIGASQITDAASTKGMYLFYGNFTSGSVFPASMVQSQLRKLAVDDVWSPMVMYNNVTTDF